MGWVDDTGKLESPGWDNNKKCDPNLAPCPLRRYLTDEGHDQYLKDRASPEASYALRCIKWDWGGGSGTPPASAQCVRAIPKPPSSMVANSLNTENQSTPSLSGSLDAGAQVNRTVQIDNNGETTFLAITTGNITMTLARPDGLVIDQAYALANPSIVSYYESPGSPGSYNQVAYKIEPTLPGTWHVILSNTSSSMVNYKAFAQFETNRTLEVGPIPDTFIPGSTVELSATLTSGIIGISGATVTAKITRTDHVTDAITLNHHGNGIYTGTYNVPNVPGYLQFTISAVGQDDGIPFEREESLILAIAPQTVQLSGGYSDQAIDEDSDGIYDSLNIQMNIHSNTAGPVLLSGKLFSGGQFVANAQNFIEILPGDQSLTLRFLGSDIHNSGKNGPYVLTDLTLSDLSFGDIPVFTGQNIFTTAEYDYQDFGQREVYLPFVTRVSDGPAAAKAVQASVLTQSQNLTVHETRTDSNGVYHLTSLEAGNWIVFPVMQNRTFDPKFRNVNLTADVNEIDFTCTNCSTSVGEMITIPAGSFQMGCDPDHNGGYVCYSNELPLHTVYLDEYRIDKYEVTNAQYAQCVAAGSCAAPGTNDSAVRPSYYNNPTYANYPVMAIFWQDAANYCIWSGKRLPSEAEWEKAARGTTVIAYPWGDQAPTCTLANHSFYNGSAQGCVGDTSEVGSYPAGASQYGVMDLAGNVWEWVNDWYRSDYYSFSPSNNPQGPDSGIYKGLRGGGFTTYEVSLRVASRNGTLLSFSDIITGFRCADSP